MEYLAHMIGAAFWVNGVPHFTQGVSGHRFQSPFAKPPGVGLSSPVTNVVWGSLNFLVGYLLLFQVGEFVMGANLDAILTVASGFLSACAIARYFSRFYPAGGE